MHRHLTAPRTLIVNDNDCIEVDDDRRVGEVGEDTCFIEDLFKKMEYEYNELKNVNDALMKTDTLSELIKLNDILVDKYT